MSASSDKGSEKSFKSSMDKLNAIKRRKHKNSKLGCPNCKKRRVKCSEDLPQCINCIKHKVKCGYLDYTEDQLAELKRVKHQDSSTKVRLEDSSLTGSQSTQGVDPIMTLPIPNGQPQLSIDDEINNLSISNYKLGTNNSGNNNNNTNNMNNILNFPQNTISQNFDNLLTVQPDLSIIYPIYSIKNTNNNLTYDNLNEFTNNEMNTNDINLYDYTMYQGNMHPSIIGEGGSFSNDSESPTGPGVPSPSSSNYMASLNYKPNEQQRMFLQTLSNSSVIPQDDLINYSSPVPETTQKFLPNAIKQETTFKKIHRVEDDYRSVLIDTVIRLGPLINSGTANLLQIRDLYKTWLNSFLFKSYFSDVMFNCLINLTTNFLISTAFNNFKTSNTNDFLALTNIKNILIIISIKYYAQVIKTLRSYLNENYDPEVCSSISYILSLMSIYDPEVNLHSINCFTDGLIGSLKYNLNASIKAGKSPPLLIPVHLKLMHNIEKSIYFPSYDPTFLNEYRQLLRTFGRILPQLTVNHVDNNEGVSVLSPASPSSSSPEFKNYLLGIYDELVEFTDKAIDEYIPLINSNLDNVPLQQEMLFKMAYKWVRFYPSRLLVTNENYNLAEKILYLFFKLMKKALYAIVPQVKYFFLRDFDSPLMLDVLNFIDDSKIFFDPEFDQFPEKFQKDLKIMTSYLIRTLNYFQKRLAFLYKTIIYESSTKDLFPIADRKEFIINIPELRTIFYDSIGLTETNIKYFSKTPIRPYHYPHYKSETYTNDNDDVDVDLLTLTESGFLATDG